jgi:hypothetical protein
VQVGLGHLLVGIQGVISQPQSCSPTVSREGNGG